MPSQAQQTHIELSYQSFRPFIHFQINIDNYHRHYDSYESTYLTGYMDGVNDKYFAGIPYVGRPINIKGYRNGFRDGYRDRRLLIQLRGLLWYKRYRFADDDYYAPEYAVRIWLERLSLAFLQAPAHRLPSQWQHRAHPRITKYRKWMSKRSRYQGYDDYYSSPNVERRFHKRIRSYRQKLNKAQKRTRSRVADDRSRISRKRYQSDSKSHTRIKSEDNRSNKTKHRSVEPRSKDHKEKVRRTRTRGSDNHEKVKKQRSRTKERSKDGQNRKRSRDH